MPRLSRSAGFRPCLRERIEPAQYCATLPAWGAWRRRVNDHREQHRSHTQRTPEMLAVQGTSERKLASGLQDERNNILPPRRRA